MNVRKEFRDAFRQYRRRLGLPLASPSSEIRVGELCIFNVDGSVTSLGNVLDLESEEIAVTRSIDTDVDPIISNGMRCRRLGDEERAKYDFPDNNVDEAFMLSRDALNVPDFALLTPSLIKSEISHTTAMKWINDNAKYINDLLNKNNVDPAFGMVLVLTQWSVPGYTRVVIPSNLVEEGVVMGLANGTSWVEGELPEGKPLTLTMVEHCDKEVESTLFVDGLSIKKISVTRRFRMATGISHYHGEREWKKHISVCSINKGVLGDICASFDGLH